MPAGATGELREDTDAEIEPQQRLYFRPLPQGQGWFRSGFTVSTVAHRTVQPPSGCRKKGWQGPH